VLWLLSMGIFDKAAGSREGTALQLGISVSATKARMFHGKVALRKSEVLRNIKEAI
jgi:hypothetical protein